MFKGFVPADEISTVTAVKNSSVRGMKRSILDVYPALEEYIDDILPKKEEIREAKGKDKVSFITLKGEPLFYRTREGPYFPTLRLLHAYPNMMPRVTVDKGAIKFVLRGADIMCPGLTSPGAECSVDLPALAPVAVYAQGKEHALAVGVTRMSTADIRSINKGVGIEASHFAGDGLWTAGPFE